jgi:hypothetical protein
MKDWMALALAGALVITIGCGDSDAAPVDPDAGAADAEVPYRIPEVFIPWEKVEVPGTVCGNGSQYKFFISRSLGGTNSNNLLIYMEPGGACWDRASCIDGTARGAANPDGITDNHMDGGGGVPWGVVEHLLWCSQEFNPAWDWTLVFIPYCTGDVHAGSRTVMYDDVEWHHQGHTNVLAATEWLNDEYPQVPQMLLTGCSAGGAGAIANYYFVREGLEGLDRGYMLNDSGPIFPAAADDPTAWSRQLHDEIKDVWGVQDLLDEHFPQYDTSDFGNINNLLAEEFPQDRLATTFYQMDYNYSLYSYERFHFEDGVNRRTPEYREEIYSMWYDDTLALKERLDGVDNHAYYMPTWRDLNDSHCLTPFTWDGTEIAEADVSLLDYVRHLLEDDQPLESYFEESCDSMEGVTLDGRYSEPALLTDLTPKCQE